MEQSDKLYDIFKSKYIGPPAVVSKKFNKSSFFPYFFKEKGKIARWNNTRGIIKFAALGTRILVADKFNRELARYFLENLMPLFPYLEEIIREGWRWRELSVKEYNTVVFFKDFCAKLDKIARQKEIKPKDFFVFQEAFLRILHRDEYAETIVKVFKKHLITWNGKYEQNREKIDSMLFDLASIFEQGPPTPSMTDFVLAYNMVFFRRYFSIQDLFLPIQEDLVKSIYYACSREIFGLILEYTNSLKEKIGRLKEEQIALAHIKQLGGDGDTEAPEDLIRFYEKTGSNWKADSDNIVQLIIRLFKSLIENLEQVIGGEWDLMTYDQKIVRQKLIFEQEAKSLLEKIKKELGLAEARFKMMFQPRISMEVFRGAEDPGQLFNSENSEYYFAHIKEILACLTQLAALFINLVDSAKSSDFKANAYLKFMIDRPVAWRGEPAYGVFNFYVGLFWKMCAFFKHKPYREMVKRLETVNQLLENQEEELRRIDAEFILEGIVKMSDPGARASYG